MVTLLSRFPSLSTTLSPKDTVLRRLDIVPGVTRMLFVGEPEGLLIWSKSNFGSSFFSIGIGFVRSLLLRWCLDWFWGDGARLVSSSAAGVPNKALLKARIANTGAGVSGGSSTLEVSELRLGQRLKYETESVTNL